MPVQSHDRALESAYPSAPATTPKSQPPPTRLTNESLATMDSLQRSHVPSFL